MSFSETSKRLVAELHGEALVRIRDEAVEERRLDGRRLLADHAGERGALGAVALARGAQAAEQVHLDPRRLGELILRQLRAALIEVVGDAHRADRVRARRPGSDLVELVERRHHRTLRLLDHVELGREVDLRRRRRAGGGALCIRRHRAARDDGDRADHGAAHQERPAIDAGRDLRLVRVVYAEDTSLLVHAASFLGPGPVCEWMPADQSLVYDCGSLGTERADGTAGTRKHRLRGESLCFVGGAICLNREPQSAWPIAPSLAGATPEPLPASR